MTGFKNKIAINLIIWIVASIVFMFVLPGILLSIPNHYDFVGRLALFYLVAPLFSVVIGINSGKDIKVDCLDINECDALATSFFNDGFNEYRIIMIPSDTEIDNVEAFINMPCLESLIVSDYPFDSDSQQIEDKYNELTEVLSNYNSYDFDCFIRPSR